MKLTKREKRQLVHQLISTVERCVLNTADKWPDDWDEIELRQFIADEMAKVAEICKNPEFETRMKEYRLTLLYQSP